jgi:hypothetical protein
LSGILDRAPIPYIGCLSIKDDEMADYLLGVHYQVKKAIEDNNTKYKAQFDSHRRKVAFEVGDLVWTVLTCVRFPVGEYNKLQERKIAPSKSLEDL